ncbi:phasin family protein [Primorskyibacter aestuariivivens]|uniref:phasin family protein n=1 Tax=Primorskyibacter aestuariivivens TaxID=1888912 RepID=UPI002301231F|nr:phasin family protein [Primorskyibacter aestuariivivens]MDA7430979.1 phasin family protein [Primorskyibacter aestuariivivens]
MAKAKQSKTDASALTDAMMAFTPMAPAVWQEIMTESARFVSERLQQDMEAQQAMMNCKTPMELLQVQTEFYQKAVQQYTEEAARMMKRMANPMGTKRSYDDVPL